MKKCFLVVVAFLFLPDITHPLEALDDFEVPLEVTTVRENKAILGPVQLKRIEGRTRQVKKLASDEKNLTGKMVENYCCFWIYQAHPPIPYTWKHMAEYPFDFQFNGEFVKNKRHNGIGVFSREKQY
ncbi:uncharacterized protein LOC108037694 [Drosophila rhopaloa]|uniref:Uncharacterized protein LOC108037694 n=1 Tax=Drosophila rhopaloa TaxID=1041015 RepID=A0A6P4DWK6_DRORH|nr:uncharacterized protein LOC108037694 [Drosophila rhopaloa]